MSLFNSLVYIIFSYLDILLYFSVLSVFPVRVCRLAVSLVDVSEGAAEPWVAMGYFSLKSKKFPRAVYFAQKVATLTAFVSC